MSKSWKKRIALTLSLALMIMLIPVSSVFAVEPSLSYVALGDSISYGLTDWSHLADSPDNGYTRMYHDRFLGGDAIFSYNNLSWPGDTTLDLLNVVGKNSKLIRDADVITISIGSNHLLGPSIEAIAGLYGLDPKDYDDLNGQGLIYDLALAVQEDGTNDIDDGIDPFTRLSWLSDEERQESQELEDAWSDGTKMFARLWPVVIKQIRQRAPDAEIYVNNMYNPLLASQILASQMTMGGSFPLYNTLDGYIDEMNDVIDSYDSKYEYEVIDVYDLFDDPGTYLDGDLSDDPLYFNIPAALSLAAVPGFNPNPGVPVNPTADFWKFFFTCDPHPTTVGHEMIFQELVTQSLS